MSNTEYTLNLSENQARVLAQILDLVLCGELDQVDEDDMPVVEDIEALITEPGPVPVVEELTAAAELRKIRHEVERLGYSPKFPAQSVHAIIDVVMAQTRRIRRLEKQLDHKTHVEIIPLIGE